MKPLRLVFVSRRFWPLLGGAERLMADLAARFVEQGDQVELVTAGWDRSWPSEIVHRGVRVSRLPQPRLRWWGTWRYMQGLAAWLARRRESFDLVYVSMLKHDAYAALGCGARRGFPVVLRAEGSGLSGDVHWQLGSRVGWRIRKRCYRADAIVAPSPIVRRELEAAGYPRDRVHYIPNAVRIPELAGHNERGEARQALAESHPLLGVSGAGPVALYTGRLHEGKGLGYLIDAWVLVCRELPGAQLWIVGEGPSREALWRQVAREGLDGRVVLAGAFDSVDEFLAAADAFVLPSLDEGMSIALLEAMAAGRAVVATDIPANQCVINDQIEGLLVPARDARALAAALLRVLRGGELAGRLGRAARQRVEREFSLDQSLREHRRVFEQVLENRRTDHRRAAS